MRNNTLFNYYSVTLRDSRFVVIIYSLRSALMLFVRKLKWYRVLFLSLFLLSGCSSYKSTWNCPVENGIGCSSIEYADEIAKQEIQLNSNTGKVKEVFLNEDYFDYSNFENPGVQE